METAYDKDENTFNQRDWVKCNAIVLNVTRLANFPIALTRLRIKQRDSPLLTLVSTRFAKLVAQETILLNSFF
jgi:hypothetical protein